MIIPAVALALVWGVCPAGAREDLLEINQVCAESTGCVLGDTPVFLVTLSSPGSYTLTSVLQLPDENVVARNENGILVDDAGLVVRNVASENRNDGIEGPGSGPFGPTFQNGT